MKKDRKAKHNFPRLGTAWLAEQAFRAGFNRNESQYAVEILCKAIRKSLLEGKGLHLKEVGTIRPVLRASRTVMMPGETEPRSVEGKWTLVIRPARSMKQELNETLTKEKDPA